MKAIFNVIECLSFDWEGTTTKVIYSCFDKEEAIGIAKGHYGLNSATPRYYDEHFYVIVEEMPVGVLSTPTVAWSSRQLMPEFLSASDCFHFASTLPSVSTRYGRTALSVTLPVITDAVVGEDWETTHVGVSPLEGYADAFRFEQSLELAELAVAKLGVEYVDLLANSAQNDEDWQMYNAFEAKYHRKAS